MATAAITCPNSNARIAAARRDVPGEDPPVLVRPQAKEGSAAKLLIGLSEDVDLLWSALGATAGSPGCSWDR